MDKCFFCKGSIEDSITNYMLDLNGQFIIIKNVPCHKCLQCGEVSFSYATMKQLEKIVAQLKQALTEVAIVEYAA